MTRADASVFAAPGMTAEELAATLTATAAALIDAGIQRRPRVWLVPADCLPPVELADAARRLRGIVTTEWISRDRLARMMGGAPDARVH